MEALLSGGGSRFISLYGNEVKLYIGVGVAESFTSWRVGSGEWVEFQRWLDGMRGRLIFGYTSFSAACSREDDFTPAIRFVVPQSIFEVSEFGLREVSSNTSTTYRAFEGVSPAESLGDAESVVRFPSLADWEADRRGGGADCYKRNVAVAIEAIRSRMVASVTIARRIPVGGAIDILGTLRQQRLMNSLSGFQYFWRDADVCFVGANPELLAIGGVGAFDTYKLSGTQERVSCLEEDEKFRAELVSGTRCRFEHDCSVKSLAKRLRAIGDVAVGVPAVVDWGNLRHLSTRFRTLPGRGLRVVDIIRSVLPHGCAPESSGFSLIRSLEDCSRGPYYGLVGVVHGDGSFQFTQNIRSVISCAGCVFGYVGAAVTRNSTPELELAETNLKAANTALVVDTSA